MTRTVLITGVSSGIGQETARMLVDRGYRVFGSVRRASDADAVQAALGDAFTPLIFDVTDEKAIAEAVRVVTEAVGAQGLTALVNNAGVAPTGPLMHVPLAEMRQLFEVNVHGLLAVTQAFLPLLGAKRGCPHPPGRIVNLSSISGGLVFPFVGAYAASKFAVEALTDGLRRELGLYGIDVVAIEPGTIRTPIWDKFDAAEAARRYGGTDYHDSFMAFAEMAMTNGRKGAPAGKVARAICKAIETGRPRPRYPLTPLWWLERLLGTRRTDRLLRKECKLS